jgi:hypothetical protein
MHVDHEAVEYVVVEEQDYEEIVEEYVEEIFMSEEFQEPPVSDTSDLAPAQGKPQCITHNFYNHYVDIYIYMCDALRCRNFMIPTCI